MKRAIAWTLLYILASQGFGCTGIIVRDHGTQYATEPYEQKEIVSETVRSAEPYERTEPILLRTEYGATIPEHWELVITDPAIKPGVTYKEVNLGGNPVSKKFRVKNFTDAQKIVHKELRAGYSVFVTRERIPMLIEDANGKKKVFLLPPGTMLLGHETKEADGFKYFIPERVVYCWNKVWGIKLRHVPENKVTKEIWLVTERYLDTRTITQLERYRDVNTKIDYTPALWAGLGGLLFGGVIGWLLHPAGGTSIVQGATCAAGTPAPR